MKNLLAKLLKVQEEMKPIPKDETNPHYKSRYFNIDGLLAELKPVLTKHGLVLMQPCEITTLTQERGEGTFETLTLLKTEIFDVESGEVLSSQIALPKIDDPQKMGSAISYYRRYALTALFALEGDDDDAERTKDHEKPVGNSQRLCVTCKKPFTPKPGTEAYAKTCYACFIATKKAAPTPVPLDDQDNPF